MWDIIINENIFGGFVSWIAESFNPSILGEIWLRSSSFAGAASASLPSALSFVLSIGLALMALRVVIHIF